MNTLFKKILISFSSAVLLVFFILVSIFSISKENAKYIICLRFLLNVELYLITNNVYNDFIILFIIQKIINKSSLFELSKWINKSNAMNS